MSCLGRIFEFSLLVMPSFLVFLLRLQLFTFFSCTNPLTERIIDLQERIPAKTMKRLLVFACPLKEGSPSLP